jgi:hypothetical protein
MLSSKGEVQHYNPPKVLHHNPPNTLSKSDLTPLPLSDVSIKKQSLKITLLFDVKSKITVRTYTPPRGVSLVPQSRRTNFPWK